MKIMENKMNASELRIGNLLYQEQTIDDWEIKSVFAGTIIQCEINPDGFEPISLTEEWLLKFGFEHINKHDNTFITYVDSGHNYFLQLDVRKKDNKYRILDNSFDDLRDFSILDIVYVHQLQNLYFALTGEELTLKK